MTQLVKKYPVPQGDYITFDTYQQIREKEESQLYRLAFGMMWNLLPRVSELLSMTWGGVDSARPEHFGYEKDTHTIKIWRNKTQTFDVLPLPDFLHSELSAFVKDSRLKPTDPIIDRHRNSVYGKCAEHGYTVGGQKKIHPHAFRRGGGIYMSYCGVPIQHISFMYGHQDRNGNFNISMTIRYLGIQKREAALGMAHYMKKLGNAGGISPE